MGSIAWDWRFGGFVYAVFFTLYTRHVVARDFGEDEVPSMWDRCEL